MNKNKQIKELEERVEQLERARSIHNEYWQTYIVGLEQRIEMLEQRPNPYDPTDDMRMPCTPVYTIGGTIVGKIGQCPIP